MRDAVNKPKTISSKHSFSSYHYQNDYYLSGPHKRAWAHLNFAIKQGNGILVLSGQSGCGKSTLVQSFALKLRENNQRHVFFSSAANFNELPDRVDQRLVVIDDAEFLSTKQLEILNACIESANEDLQYLQFLLVGSEKLEQIIADIKHSNFRNKVVFSYQLGLMNPAETMKYAQLQLSTKGWQVNSEVAKELLRDLYDCSSGNAELINKYLDQLQAANELYNVQHIALNRNSLPESLNQDDLKSNIATNSMSDTLIDDPNRINSVPWFRSKKIKVVGLGYLASVLIAIFVFHSTTFFAQKTTDNKELVVNNQLLETSTVLPVSSNTSKLMVGKDIIDIANVDRQVSEQSIVAATVSVQQPLPKPTGITRIKNKPVVHNNTTKSVSNIVKNTHNVKKEVLEVSEQKQDLATKTVTNLDRLFNAPEENSFTVNKTEEFDPNALTHTQEVELQLVTTNSRLPTELEKIFRQEFSPELDKIKLNRLVADFEVAYEFGDLKKIDNLFLETIKSNKIEGKKALKDEYKKLFNITQSRNIRIYDLFWRKEGNAVLGKGAFKVAIFERGSAQKSTFTGNIDLKVIESNQSFMFSELFYNYGNL